MALVVVGREGSVGTLHQGLPAPKLLASSAIARGKLAGGMLASQSRCITSRTVLQPSAIRPRRGSHSAATVQSFFPRCDRNRWMRARLANPRIRWCVLLGILVAP